MMIVCPTTAVLEVQTSNGPALNPRKSVAMIFGEAPEAKHARFVGLVRGLHIHFLANRQPEGGRLQ